ncbi:DUF4153 domain-containing protein [Janibacter massiliensis]|uniref:DUF4153 domain-containing protein n=1 Tax=Janibacter massiliensis TaxID=2058291 RepID=UPI000D0EECEF|nr:DUF4173 domain-containing protein [Janibacter massiliensis]
MSVTPPPASSARARDVWAERVTAPQPRLVLVAALVGLLAAIAVPGHRVGLGAFVTLLAGAAAMWLASPRRWSRWSLLTVALGLLLILPTVLRDDMTYPVVALLVALVLGAVACTGATHVVGMVLSALAWPLAALRGLPLLGRTASALGRMRNGVAVLRTTVASLAVLVVLGGLLASADAVLGSWAGRLVPSVDALLLARAVVGISVAAVLLAGLYLAINPPAVDAARPGALTARRIPPLEWQIPVGVALTVLTAFLIAQTAGMVGGHGYVLATTGLTYAEYARQGFAQLTLATALVLGLVAGVRTWGRADRPRDRMTMQVMLGSLCVLGLTLVASALHRMALYQGAFVWTVTRVSADLIEIWLGLLLVATLVTIVRPALRAHLGRTALASGAALVALWSCGNVPAFVAERNIARFHDTGRIDAVHLGQLGHDAAPTVLGSDLPEPVKSCARAVAGLAENRGSADGLLGWNLARHRARTALAAAPAGAPACASGSARY